MRPVSNLILFIFGVCLPNKMPTGYAPKMACPAKVCGLMRNGWRGAIKRFADNAVYGTNSMPVLKFPITVLVSAIGPHQTVIPIIGEDFFL